MTARAAAVLLALLLNSLASSEGDLSPPLNLSVELLDFIAVARWLPGPGNPKGTRYSLEFIELGYYTSLQWNRAEYCTNITSKECSLLLNQRTLRNYFMRVRAEWRDERSEWTSLPRSFQPYEYTLLSAPNVTVSAEHHSIWISLRHPLQTLTEVRLRFSVDLFHILSSSKAKKHVAHNITTESSRFAQLPFGNYCVNAYAFLTARSKFNNTTTMCVFLRQDHKEEKVLWVVGMSVLLLFCILTAIGLVIAYCYVRPSSNVPNALCIAERNEQVLILDSEELQNLSLCRMFKDDFTATPHERDGDSSQGYYTGAQRIAVENESFEETEGGLLEDEDVIGYSTAANMEETDEHSPPTERHARGSTPRTSFSGLYPLCENTLDWEPDTFDGEGSYSCFFEQSYSSDGEIDGLPSDVPYEPRPDPCCMFDVQDGSKR